MNREGGIKTSHLRAELIDPKMLFCQYTEIERFREIQGECKQGQWV